MEHRAITSSCANQLTGFYIRATLPLNGLTWLYQIRMQLDKVKIKDVNILIKNFFESYHEKCECKTTWFIFFIQAMNKKIQHSFCGHVVSLFVLEFFLALFPMATFEIKIKTFSPHCWHRNLVSQTECSYHVTHIFEWI